jgi:hypothetical protein
LIYIYLIIFSKVGKRDEIVFEVINVDQNTGRNLSIGSVRFSLDLIEKQEEYDVLLEVPDPRDENEVYAKINAKIQFIWSFYKFYSEELIKSEERIETLKNLIYQKQNILKNLNGIFIYSFILFLSFLF